MAGFSRYESGRLPPGVIVVKGDWAGVARQTGGGSAGPTGAPWVDSNGWRIRLARMQNPGRTVWVECEAAKDNDVIRPEQYLLGVADAAAHSGRWVVTLDSAFQKGLDGRAALATTAWERLRGAVKFFGQREDRETLPARAALAVVSDFAGDNEFLSHEILNLAARQQLPYLLVDKSKFTRLPDGLKAVVYADAQAPSTVLRAALAAFVKGGGLLITGAAWGKAEGTALPDSPTVRYTVYTVGQGRIAIPTDSKMDDPYLVAADAQMLLGHRHDVMRLWNGGILGAYPTGDAKRTVVHLINYSGRVGGDPVSLWIAGAFQNATLFSFEFAEPKKLALTRQRGGVEIHLPPLAVYGAVEVR